MKTYVYDIESGMIHYNSSIRSRFTIIRILLDILRYLFRTSPASISKIPKSLDIDKIRLVIHIDKMSRIFIHENNKIHTFHFPFILNVENEKNILSFRGFQITNATCSILEAVFSEMSEDEPLDKLLERYWSVSEDIVAPKEEYEMYSKLITYLLSFDIGYLRFDHDEIRANDSIHPKNHIDINYTNGTTFKLGLYTQISYQEMIDILDITTDCAFLSIPNKE